ncbi:MAG: LacI family DNA-binding transcriptional regulator [Eubacteriales bacterium]|nr:LacI family DNA-binding transcriptional regulator [Eubacteriales bacterium]
MVTLREISEKCGCSVATVSKALNGMPDISEATTSHICSVAAEMGYMPNAAARTLKTNRSRMVGMLMFLRQENVWTHDYFSQIAASIQDVMEQNGYDITPINCNRSGLEGNHLNYCRHRGYDGVILMSAGFDEAELTDLEQGEIPLVTIDYDCPNRSSVLSDNTQGTGELTRYAYMMGHRRIACIHGEDTSVSRTRQESYKEALRELGLPVREEYIRSGYYHDPLSAAEATIQLLSLPQKPTCILYQDDYSYLGCINYLKEKGFMLPENVSVAGYDGIRIADIVSPRLTTFRQDNVGIGREAAKMLLSAMEKPRNFVPRHLVLPGQLIRGETIRSLD